METDVLVIGGGGAGLIAACEARTRGLGVILATKARAGYASSTTYAGGGFSFPYGKVSAEEHRRKTLETGRGLNLSHMLDLIILEAPRYMERLQEFGVELDFRDGGATVSPYGISPAASGTGLTLPLVRHAQRLGVRVLHSTMVTGLFLNESRCTGARTLNTRTGTLGSISARAVVLATGGLGRLYSRTDNPVRTTGDGYALAAQLGLPLVDMEFVQFYPMSFSEPGFVVWMVPLDLVDYAPVTDERGTPFLQDLWKDWGIKNGAEANLYTRDRSSLAIAQKWREGRKVLLHVQQVPAEVWESRRGWGVRRQFPRHRKPSDGPVEVRPLQHYAPGGVRVDSMCRTGIPGLLAAGEVTGGTDGANRVGGNALSMTVVHGFKAAEAAESHIHNTAFRVEDKNHHTHPADQLAQTWERQTEGISPKEMKDRINQISDMALGPLRNRQDLEQVLQELDTLERLAKDIRARTPREVAEGYEALNLLLVGRLVARAALERSESRGVHFREDYPSEDPNWLRHVEISMEGDRIRVTPVPSQ